MSIYVPGFFKKMEMKKFIVRYESDVTKNIKYYSVYAPNKTKAIKKVSAYIRQYNHHNSINYGFGLCVLCDKTIKMLKPILSYIVPD